MKHIYILLGALIGTTLLTGCGRLGDTMPSMVNANRAELVEQSVLDRQELTTVDESYLNVLAEQVRKYGDGPVELTMTYDPSDKDFTAMKAVNTLADLSSRLQKKGVHNLTTQTLPVDGQEPALMVAFDTVGVQGPSSCNEMPGMYDYNVTSDVSNYRFGCAIETNIARQIARPADLRGVDHTEHADGRRDTNVIDARQGVAGARTSGDLAVWGTQED